MKVFLFLLKAECIAMLKAIQKFHMEERKLDDIGYNFIIGGDGNVYEGKLFKGNVSQRMISELILRIIFKSFVQVADGNIVEPIQWATMINRLEWRSLEISMTKYQMKNK